MSIGPIEDNPVGDDEVTIVDPGDVTVEPSYGHDTVPWNVSGEVATGHADPDAENITHVPGVSRGREVDGMDFFDLDFRAPDHGRGTDPDAAFDTGTEAHPDRWVRDEALQVRQLLPTGLVVNTYTIPPGAKLQVAWQRLERMRITLRVLNISAAGGTAVFIGPSPGSINGVGPSFGLYGFPLIVPVADESNELTLSYSGELWVTATDQTILYVLEEFRTDVDAS